MADAPSTRGRISAIAAQLDRCDRQLRSLPTSATAFEARRHLEHTRGMVALLHAQAPEPMPRVRERKLKC